MANTLAEQTEQLLRESREMYRDAFLLCWDTLTEGWPELVRKRVLRFFERETTPAYWLQLPPEEADAQLNQWLLLDPKAAIEEAA